MNSHNTLVVFGAAMLALAVFNAVMRAIPDKLFVRVESASPRLANLLRFARAAGVDAYKAARALWAIFTGRPWVEPPVVAQVEQKASEAAAKVDAATVTIGELREGINATHAELRAKDGAK